MVFGGVILLTVDAGALSWEHLTHIAVTNSHGARDVDTGDLAVLDLGDAGLGHAEGIGQLRLVSLAAARISAS